MAVTGAPLSRLLSLHIPTPGYSDEAGLGELSRQGVMLSPVCDDQMCQFAGYLQGVKCQGGVMGVGTILISGGVMSDIATLKMSGN